MATFSELVTRVEAELIDVPDRTQSQLASFVNQSIRKLQFRHDFSVCKTSTAVLTTAAGTNVLSAVPSDFLRLRKEPPHLIDSFGRLSELGFIPQKEQAERRFASTAGGEFTTSQINGTPQVLSIDTPSDVNNTRDFLVYPMSDQLSLYTTAPAGEYRVRIPYIRQLPDLSGVQTNWFTSNAEECIIYAAVSIGFYFNHDEQRGDIWFKRAAGEVQDVLARDKNESIGGNSTLDISFDVLGPKTPVGDEGIYRGNW